MNPTDYPWVVGWKANGADDVQWAPFKTPDEARSLVRSWEDRGVPGMGGEAWIYNYQAIPPWYPPPQHFAWLVKSYHDLRMMMD